jgi:hypothetical protein
MANIRISDQTSTGKSDLNLRQVETTKLPQYKKTSSEIIQGYEDFSVVNYEDIDSGEWNHFISRSGKGWVTDYSEWIDFFVQKCGYKNLSFVIKDQKNIKLAFPLFIVPNLIWGKRIVSGPFFDYGGPIILAGWNHLATLAHRNVEKVTADKGVNFAEIRNPSVPIPGSISNDYYCHFIMELNIEEELLFKSLKNNVRRAIKKASKSCSVKLSNKTEDMDTVWEHYKLAMKGHGTPPWGDSFLAMFKREMRRGRGHVVIVFRDDDSLGGAYLWGDGKTSRLEISASTSEEARKLQVNSLLFWRSILLANQLGYGEINLTRTLKNGPQYDFKKRWNAKEQPLPFVYVGTKKVPHDPRRTHLRNLAKIWRYLPSKVGYLLGDIIRSRMAM